MIVAIKMSLTRKKNWNSRQLQSKKHSRQTMRLATVMFAVTESTKKRTFIIHGIFVDVFVGTDFTTITKNYFQSSKAGGKASNSINRQILDKSVTF